ncbi:MAG: class I SAM-dependent methyltransferase [Minisyncoccia bacterium]
MNCPACGSAENRKIGKSGIYALNLCDNCGVEYWTPLEHPGEEFYETNHLHDIVEARNLQWRHREFLKNHPSAGDMLDIGCGTGEFLASCRGLGFKVMGVDIAPRNVAEARNRYGIEVFKGTLAGFINEFPGKRFDVITFFEIVEHLADPKSFFDDVKKLLKPNGCIIMSVPNVDRFGGPKEKEEIPPNHLFRWRKSALEKFLSSQGFRDIAITLQPISSEFFLVRGWFSFGIAGKKDPRNAPQGKTSRIPEIGMTTELLQKAAKIKNKIVYPLAVIMAAPLRLLGYKYWDMYAVAALKNK